MYEHNQLRKECYRKWSLNTCRSKGFLGSTEGCVIGLHIGLRLADHSLPHGAWALHSNNLFCCRTPAFSIVHQSCFMYPALRGIAFLKNYPIELFCNGTPLFSLNPKCRCISTGIISLISDVSVGVRSRGYCILIVMEMEEKGLQF